MCRTGTLNRTLTIAIAITTRNRNRKCWIKGMIKRSRSRIDRWSREVPEHEINGGGEGEEVWDNRLIFSSAKRESKCLVLYGACFHRIGVP